MFTQVRHDLPASALAECLEVLELVRQHSPQLLLLTPLFGSYQCVREVPGSIVVQFHGELSHCHRVLIVKDIDGHLSLGLVPYSRG